MTPSQRIRAAALFAARTDSLTDLFGYYSEAWVLVLSRIPHDRPQNWHWFNFTDTERRMFLLFVAEALES